MVDEFDMEDDEDYGTDYGEDLGYVDPSEMAGYGQPGPTRAAAAAGDINYQSAPFEAYEGRQNAAIQALRDARARAVEALRPRDDKSRYLALAAGFLSPTRTGGFGESVSNALQNYLPYKQAQRQEELGYQGALSKYDMDLAQAEYEQSMKPPVFTDIYEGGGKQKVMIVNGRPYPVGGVYKPSGAGGAFRDKVDWLKNASPEELSMYDKYLRPRGPEVNVSVAGDKKFEQKLGELDAEGFNALQQAGRAAPVNIAKHQRLGALLGQITGGKYQGTIHEFNKALKTFGFDPATLGITDDTALTDAANAMSREMALQLRNPAGGAGMPGALSDSDRNFLVSMTTNVETDPDAVPLMIKWNIKLEQRNADVARIARNYAKKNNGRVDMGFYDELAEWSEKNPLFTEQDQLDIEKLGAGGESTDKTKPEAPKTLDDLNGLLKGSGKKVIVGPNGPEVVDE